MQGFFALQVLQPGLGWQARLDQLRPIMVAQAQHLDVAFIRHHQHELPVPAYLASHYRLPYFDGTSYNLARHAWYCHTPDAHGIQILTDSHLEQASDLTRWHIQSLGNDRHLVQAPDLQPWYSAATPDPDVLDRARQDFGEIILSPDNWPGPGLTPVRNPW